MKIPYRIETDRLVIRCWEPSDAASLKRAVEMSVDHLSPWADWIAERPQTSDEQINLLRGFRAAFDSDRDYIYGIFSKDESEVFGSTGLHPRRGPGTLEIGYWVRSDQINKGIATEVSGALTDVAFRVFDVDRVEIRCSNRNLRSARVPEKLDFTHEASLRDIGFATADKSERDQMMIWSMFREEHSPIRSDVTAFDAIGHQI